MKEARGEETIGKRGEQGRVEDRCGIRMGNWGMGEYLFSE